MCEVVAQFTILNQIPTIYFTPCSVEGLSFELITYLSGIDWRRESGHRLTASDRRQLREYMEIVAGSPFFIEARPLLTTSHIKNTIARANRDIRLVLIDDLQFITLAEEREDRTEKIEEVVTSLERLGNILNLTIVLFESEACGT